MSVMPQAQLHFNANCHISRQNIYSVASISLSGSLCLWLYSCAFWGHSSVQSDPTGAFLRCCVCVFVCAHMHMHVCVRVRLHRKIKQVLNSTLLL